MKYKVTACWYETVVLEADDEAHAVEQVCTLLSSEIRRIGYVDDFIIEKIDE